MIDDRLQAVFRMVLGNEDITLTDTTTAADIEGWDSVAHINLMFAVEEEFGVRFGGNEFARFTNIGDLKQNLERKLSR